MTKVEQFETIRRAVLVHGKSIRAVAQEQGVHRRTVREALNDAVPRPRRGPVREPKVLTTAMRAQIDQWLVGDREVHRKQRHTARRIFRRLQAELDFQGAQSTVRGYVRGRRRELGQAGEAFVPQAHEPGQECEVDWYEADVDFPWGRERVQFFQMRACFSGREFNMAFPNQTQQAFLEAHVAAFEYFGGVFAISRYDNLSSAVKKVIRGRRRIETDRFIALRSHYLYASEFCLPGIKGAHEKGGVEGGVGRFRRNHLVPVPQVESYEALNRLLLDACTTDDLRRIDGHEKTIIEDWEHERTFLRPLPENPFETADVETVGVDTKGCVRVRTNRYSVPIRLAGLRVEYQLNATTVDLMHGGKCVATHSRLQGRHQIRVNLDHYVELLWNKPGALKRSLPLRQARDRGEWPAAYDRLWVRLGERSSPSEAARQMLCILMMHREFTPDEVLVAVELALEHGCYDPGAVSVLLRQITTQDKAPDPLRDLGELAKYDRPIQGTADYDRLLTRSATQAVH